MKISLAISILILLIAAGIGARDRRQLEELRATASRLRLETSRPASADTSRAERPRRGNQEAVARQLATDIIAYLHEIQNTPEQDRAALYRRFPDLMKQVTLLDETSFKSLVASLRDAGNLSGTEREEIVLWCLSYYAGNRPEAVLALIADGFDLKESPRFQSSAVNNALGNLARMAPAAAIAWLDQHGSHPSVTPSAQTSAISAIGEKDPATALRLIHDLNIANPAPVIEELLANQRTVDQRTNFLDSTRKHFPADSDSFRSIVRNLAGRAVAGGFDSGSEWITRNLSTDELAILSSGKFLPYAEVSEPGKWITWLESTLPPDPSHATSRQILSAWTREDYVAAGDWLNAAPAGPAKIAAIQSYAETLAPYQPAAAAQWALALPAGEARDSSLKAIHRNWPKADPEGAAAFAEVHGIK